MTSCDIIGNSNILERILLSDTIVIGSGYSPYELPRIQQYHPNYIGVGGSSPDDIIPQMEMLSYQAITNGHDCTANFLLDIRGGRKFNIGVVDRCVFNFFVKEKPHPIHGFVPGTNEPNGCVVTVIDQNCFGIKLLQQVLEPNATLYFYNSVEKLNTELEALLPEVKIVENVGDGIVPKDV